MMIRVCTEDVSLVHTYFLSASDVCVSIPTYLTYPLSRAKNDRGPGGLERREIFDGGLRGLGRGGQVVVIS